MILIQITIYWSILTFCISGVVEDRPKDESGIPLVTDMNINTKQEKKFVKPSLNTPNMKNYTSRKLQAVYIDYKEMEKELEDENYFIDDDDLTTAQRFKRHWKRVLTRCIILLAILVFIVLLFRCLAATIGSFILPTFQYYCSCLSCLPCCKRKDTMYYKVEEYGKELGMEINEESYNHLLEICEEEGMLAVRDVKRV